MTFIEQFTHPLTVRDYFEVLKREAIIALTERAIKSRDLEGSNTTVRPPALPAKARQLNLEL